MIQKIGFVLFLIGGAGMDSPDRTIPVIMVLTGLLIITISAIKERRANMEYRIEYANGKCRNYAHSRKDLLEWLGILKDETITDIRKIYKNGIEDSVLEKYRKYIKEKSPAHTPTKAMCKTK